ncbi:hypothetical protein FCV25MIE_32390 [Fagus crenata]
MTILWTKDLWTLANVANVGYASRSISLLTPEKGILEALGFFTIVKATSTSSPDRSRRYEQKPKCHREYKSPLEAKGRVTHGTTNRGLLTSRCSRDPKPSRKEL